MITKMWINAQRNELAIEMDGQLYVLPAGTAKMIEVESLDGMWIEVDETGVVPLQPVEASEAGEV